MASFVGTITADRVHRVLSVVKLCVQKPAYDAFYVYVPDGVSVKDFRNLVYDI